MSTPTPDDAFARQLVVGSHAEGVTCLAVAIVVEDTDRVLLIAAPARDFIDTAWELPSGLVLPGETLHEALYRIVATTTGLEVDNVTGYLGHHDHVQSNSNILRLFMFSATAVDPGQVCRAATIGHQWRPHDELVVDADGVIHRYLDLRCPPTKLLDGLLAAPWLAHQPQPTRANPFRARP